MRRTDPRPSPGRRRPGQTLILFALLLPVLLGLVGLVIDGGLVMAAVRQAQNAADAAALAAAMDRVQGKSVATAAATGTAFVRGATYNNLPNATVVINIPPASGPSAGNSSYVEALVTSPVQTTLIHVLGVVRNQQIRVRAVASTERFIVGAGAIALDPNARPGLSVQGGADLIVNGTVIDNSEGSGLNENYQTVNLGLSQYAATTSNNSIVKARDVFVVGGVDRPANYLPYVEGSTSPLHAGVLPTPDPLKHVPVPVTGMPGVNPTPRGVVDVSNGTHTLNPGVYTSIKISGANTQVTFNPGVYIIKPANNTTNALSITTGARVRGEGVMFYNTGSDFNLTTGLPDINDRENAPPAPGNANFGDITLNGSDTRLEGISDPASPFDGLLIFQRRRNVKSADIQGSGSNNYLAGTIYAKWANFKITGSGTFAAQFVAGTIAVAGGGEIIFDTTQKHLATPLLVFLVE